MCNLLPLLSLRKILLVFIMLRLSGKVEKKNIVQNKFTFIVPSAIESKIYHTQKVLVRFLFSK